jgi:hypothetical protein
MSTHTLTVGYEWLDFEDVGENEPFYLDALRQAASIVFEAAVDDIEVCIDTNGQTLAWDNRPFGNQPYFNAETGEYVDNEWVDRFGDEFARIVEGAHETP